MNVISLHDISRTIQSGPDAKEKGEHPFARKVGYTLHMAEWRRRKREAEAAKDYDTLDGLEREWEFIQSVY